jgi:hypothetical protein
MPRTKRAPLVIGHDGKDLYVEAKASGIHPLVIFIDGMPFCLEGQGKRQRTLLRVTDVVAWHEKVLAESRGQSGSQNTWTRCGTP